jgi:hypothetical protein
MKKYKVTLSGEYAYEVILEANSEEEAAELAKDKFDDEKLWSYGIDIYSPNEIIVD